MEAMATTVREGDILQGKYRVERVLGIGGMGFVVAAHHLHLDEKVAIKSLLPQGLGHPEILQRFEREARTAVKIKSEHVARVLDVARFDDGTPYLVMEHLDGHDLSKWLQTRGPLPVEQAVEFVVQACEAIAEAHLLGIVHRDLKPSNLFVVKGRDGLLMTKVIDFGISKNAAELSGSGGQNIAMTGTRSVLGSPEYMSPEQFTAPKTVDWRTDIWSIGVTLFELLTGRLPFSGDELITLALKITQQAPEPMPIAVLGHAMPPGLSFVIRRCLEKDRAARFQDVAELALALAPFAPSRTQALIQRIGRIVQATFSSGALAKTTFAQPLPIPDLAKTQLASSSSSSPPTASATSWPSAHPSARRHATTASAMMPLVSSIPAPAARPDNGRLVMGLGLAAAGVLGVLVMVGVCTSLILRKPSTAAAASNDPITTTAQTEASSSPVIVTAAPELSSEPPPSSPAMPTAKPRASSDAATFRGTHDVSRVSWRFGSEIYRAVIHTNGTTGYADVSFIEPGHGPVVVRENLTLQHGAKGWTYVGSNPRYADDGSPANFLPNVFYMTEGKSWTFTETCVVGVGACTHLTSG